MSGADLSADKRARGYVLYFEAMRAAHAGQALDIDGQHHLLPPVVESGDATLLEARVLAVHRLKSAIPPAALARLAAVLGDAPEEIGRGLSALFEAYGVAFQIVDDVLNLRGFENGLKDRGEDIRAGKVTAPVARALSLLGHAERRRLAEILTARVKDEVHVAAAIALVDGCGALDACAGDARALVESAWQKLDALLPDSQTKMRLRAFGWFILDRHY
jgi:geranylgeranyl pyrophosphate synthase